MEPEQCPGAHQKLPWLNHSIGPQLLQSETLAAQNVGSSPVDYP